MSPGLKSSRIGTNRPAPLSSATLNALTVGACLTSVLEEAARYYATNPVATGCLAPEGTRSNDEQAREAARAFNRAAEGVIHASLSLITTLLWCETRLPKFSGVIALLSSGHPLIRGD
jgi:hypothetical protein